MLPGAKGKPKFMLIETKDEGGGDSGGEDFAAAVPGSWTMYPSSDSSCPNQPPCIDCGDKCQRGVHKGQCTYGLCEVKSGCKGSRVKCSGDGLWEYG